MNSKASDVSEGVEPCPFCGSPASTMRGRGWSVACDGGVHDCDVAPETTEFATEAEAIAAWNRRATLSPPLPSLEVERLREVLEPFAAVARDTDEFDPDYSDDSFLTHIDRDTMIRLGDCRRALSALSALPLDGGL